MSDLIEQPRDRILQLAVTTGGTPGAPTYATEPHIILSPKAANGLPTVGFLLGLLAPSAGAAVAGSGGFSVTVWRLVPTLRRYLSCLTVSLPFDQQYSTPDLGAGHALYFQFANVATDGTVLVCVSEFGS